MHVVEPSNSRPGKQDQLQAFDFLPCDRAGRFAGGLGCVYLVLSSLGYDQEGIEGAHGLAKKIFLESGPLNSRRLIRPPTPRPWQCCGVKNDFRHWTPLPEHLGPALASGGKHLGGALAAIPASSSGIGTRRGLTANLVE
jgi:hypothetical protein